MSAGAQSPESDKPLGGHRVAQTLSSKSCILAKHREGPCGQACCGGMGGT